MSQIIEVIVPDIGNFKDVPVIELLVKPGDTVKAEDALLTLESDKATIDIPSPADGIVKELKISVGDKVSEGTLVAVLEVETTTSASDVASSPASAPAPVAVVSAAPVPAPQATPEAGQFTGTVDLECEMLVE